MRLCTRCIMDTTDPGIRFDEQGVCNHCREYDRFVRDRQLAPDQRDAKFKKIIQWIQDGGRGRKYDSILGISGGVDSSYLAWRAWKNGLRTLLVHMDNSWDSELAVKNVENLVKTTGFDYYNHVVDWEEFKDLQLAYLRASVVDVEVVTDHAIVALVYRLARQFGIRYILTGVNRVTETVMPQRGWNYPYKNDLTNLRAIHRRFGQVTLKTYPTLSLAQIKCYQCLRGFEHVDLLDYLAYDATVARAILEREFNWRYYGGKHWESVFTKFYQAYILPKKFNVDKRKAHLSNLICSGQITRAQALERMQQDIYSPALMKEDYEFVVKKLGLTAAEFEEIMARPPVPHEAYPTEINQLSYQVQSLLYEAIHRTGRFTRNAIRSPLRRLRDQYRTRMSVAPRRA